MIHHIPAVLDQAALDRVHEFMAAADLVDGSDANPDPSVKRNLQVSQSDEGVSEISDLVSSSLSSCLRLVHLAFPKAMTRPTFSRYEPGMNYGPHSDEPLMGDPAIRCDISCTVFLSDPSDYVGGELELWLGSARVAVKHDAGDAILYPTGAIHQVRPVTEGVRQVAVTWIQSYIGNPQQREILGQYYQMMARVAPSADKDARTLLESVRTNLFRMWAEG